MAEPDRNQFCRHTCRVVLIGINYIGSETELHGCINDVVRVRGYLDTTYGHIPASCIQILTDRRVYLRGAAKPRPTRANIVAALKWLVSDCVAGDRRFLHYSGHGCRILDESWDEVSGMDSAIVPVDADVAGIITDDEMHRILVAELPDDVKLTVVMDCCHSETMLDLSHMVGPGKLWQKKRHMKNATGIVMLIAGCGDDQTSDDAADAQGAFTAALLSILAEIPAANCVDQMTRIRQHLRLHGHMQVPKLSTNLPIDTSLPIRLL